jgi:hypothetical protein
MDYDQQPAEYSDRDQTTAAPVPDAGEDDWCPLVTVERPDGDGQTDWSDWTEGGER